MATIQEQLRAIVADQQPGICLHEVADEAADVIDALVEALAEIENEACKGLDLGETRDSLIDIKFRSRAALSRARGDIPTES